MNRIYRIVFNRSAGLWQVVGEHARGHGKSRGRSRALGAMVALAAACGSSPAWAQVTIIASGDVLPDNAAGWNAAVDLMVGNTRSGEITVLNGGRLYSAAGGIGTGPGGIGTATVTGSTSSWSVYRDLSIGAGGTGTLNLVDGGSLVVVGGGIVSLAPVAGGTGTINIGAAPGAAPALAGTLSADEIRFGAGMGTLNFNTSSSTTFSTRLASSGPGAGAINHYAGTTFLTGDSAGFQGVVTARGGQLRILDKLGSAEAKIDGGAAAGNTAGVLVAGADAEWTVSDNLFVGGTGQGWLTIQNGGLVSNRFGSVNAAQNGSAQVTVSASTWNNTLALLVGADGGGGTVSVQNQGQLTSVDGYVGRNAGGDGSVTVRGPGSAWTNSGFLRVGDMGGRGLLSIQNGGVVSNTDSYVGSMDGSVGNVEVRGGGAVWNNLGSMTLGYGLGVNSGSLTVADGGEVNVGASGTGAIALAPSAFLFYRPSGTINIGGQAGQAAAGAGVINASAIQFGAGDATLNFNHTDAGYRFSAALDSGTNSGASHRVNQVAGTTLLSGANSGFKGRTTVSGGKLVVLGSLGGSAEVTGGTLQYGDGAVGVASNLTGDLRVAGASSTLSVQGPATLAVAGNIDLADGTILDVKAGTGGPSLRANTVTLGDGVTFKLSGIADESQLDAVLIDSTSGITGDFAAVSVGGFTGPVDYLTVNTRKSADDLQYRATYAPSWTASNNLAHGTFTLANAPDRFQLGVALTDQAANIATGWNGRTLTKAGNGTLVLSGANTYSGGTLITGGMLQVDRNENLGNATGAVVFDGGGLAVSNSFITSRAITLAQSGRVDVATGRTLLLAGGVSGGGDLIKTGAGTLHLTNGGNTYSNTRIQSGMLIGSATSVRGNVENHGTLVFQQLADGTFGGSLFGDGVLEKTGTGTLELTGNHASYTGHTKVWNGKLVVIGALGGSAQVAGGALQFGNELGGAASRLGGNLSVAGTGSVLSVQGPATLAVAGDIGMADHTALDIAAGAGGPAITAGSVTLGDGVSLAIRGINGASLSDVVLIETGSGITGDFGSVSVGGYAGTVDYLGVNTRKSADNLRYLASYGLSWLTGNNLAHGTFTLTDATDEFEVRAALADQAANGATGWDGRTLTKAGAGTLVLSGANSYSGGTRIDGGTLRVDRDANLGAAAAGLTFNGGTLATTGTFDISRAMTLAQAGRVDVAAGTTLGLSGEVSGNGMLVKKGSGTLSLRSGNTHAGGTMLDGGTLRIAHDSSLGAANSLLIINGGTLATTTSFGISRSIALGISPDAGFDVSTGTTLGVSGAVLGGGRLVKRGAGALVLGGSNSYGGGTAILDGTLQVSRDDNLGAAGGSLTFGGGTLATTGSFSSSRAITLAQAGNIDVAAGNVLTLTGQVSGSADLVKAGAGVLRLDNAANAYRNTWVQRGSLIGDAASISGNVINDGALVFQQTVDGIFRGDVSGSGSLTASGAGRLSLTGVNTYTGGTRIEGGMLQVERDANLGATAGSLTLNAGMLATTGSFDSSRAVLLTQAGMFDVRAGTTLGLGGTVSGNGALIKGGAGTLVMSGVNDYSGGTILADGTLRVGSDASLGAAAGALVFSGGTLATTGTFDIARAVVLAQTGRFDVAAGTTLGLTSTVSDGAGLVKQGGGTLVLRGSNSHDGGTTIAGGTLQIDRDANLGDAIGGLAFHGGALATTGSFTSSRAVTLAQTGRFDVAASTTLGVNGTVSGAGGLVKSGGGAMVLNGSNSYIGGTTIADGILRIGRDANLGAAAGGLTFNGGTLATTGTFDISRAVTLAQAGRVDVAAGTTLGLSGLVSGGGSLVKAGAGTLVLDGINAYGGGTRIEGGTLQVARDESLGHVTGALVFGGGALAATDSFTTSRAITLAQAGRVDVAAGTTLGLAGGVSGSGDLVKVGTGTLRLSNAGNAYGNTRIQSGTLIGNAGSVRGNVDNGGMLVFEQAADGTFAGAISGSGALVKTGTGALDLTGNHAGYTGKTTVSEGKLVVQGVLSGLADVAGGVLQFGNGVAGAASSLGGNLRVAGGSTLSVQGPATLAVAGDIGLADHTVLDIAAGAGGPSITADSITLGDGVAFRLSGISSASQLDKVLIDTRSGIGGEFGSVSVGGFTGAVDYLNVNTRKSADNRQYLATYGLTWTAGNNLSHGTFTLANATDRFVVSAPLVDQMANAATGWDGRTLTKAGAGKLVLAGNNSYTGGTRLAGGTLQVDRDANLGAATGGLTFSGGTLATTGSFDTARAITLVQAGRFDVATGTSLGLAGVVSGNGGLVKQGGGTLVLSGSNSHDGGTTIEAGTLQIDRDANLGDAIGGLAFHGGALATTGSFTSSRAVTLAQTGRFDVAASTTLGVNGAVSGAGGLVKSGGGAMVLNGSNSYIGGTTIADGILRIGRDANLGAAAGGLTFNGGTLATTGTFDISRAVTLAQAGRVDVAAGTTLGLSGLVSGGGSLVKAGAGTLVLDGINAYGGGTRIDGGTLQIARDESLGHVTGALVFGGGALATTDSFTTSRAITLAQAGRVDVAAGTTLGLAGGVSGSGDLVKVGTGTLRLSNAGNAYGNTRIQSGTLIGNAGSVRGNVDNGGMLVFEQATDGTFAGAISGSGALVKTGTGALDLTGNHAGYTGKTTVSEGKLVVQGVLGGLVDVTGGVLQFGNGVAGAASSLGGNLRVAGGSTLSVQGPATLAVAGDIGLADHTVLDIAAGAGGPSITADSITLGDGVAFRLSGISSASQLDKVLIDTRSGIGGEFGSVSVGGFTGAVDYLNVNTRKSADNRQYLATYGLTWTAGNNLSHGTFTLANATDRFVVSAPLVDQMANAATGWDGRTLTKAGAGTLVLAGNNSYTGGTRLAGGTLQVDRDANLGAATGGLTFSGGTLATTGSFDTSRTITLVQAGRFDVAAGTLLGLAGTVAGSADLIKAGAGTLRLDNAGNTYRDTRILAGTLIANAGSLRGNVDNGGTLVFEQPVDAAYGGAISGNGAFIKNGAGTLGLTGDSSGFSGSTTINGGRLALNGRLGGSISIGAGGVLGGSGTIGSGAGSTVTVAPGGILSPGNSIGTLTVDGDLVVQPGARFEVEANPAGADADLVRVTGSAALNGGSVAHIGANGNYGLRSSYTILAADGALSGEFDAVTSDFAFLKPTLAYDYDGRRVTLDLARNDEAMISAAATRNQRASAGAVDSIGIARGHQVYDAIAKMPDDKGLLRSSFDQLSGEIHASAKTVLLQDSRYVRDAVGERLRSAVGGVAASSAPVLASAGSGQRLAPATAKGAASWIQAMGSWSHIDSDGNAARVKSSTAGFLMGADTPVSDAWRLGMMAGYSRTDFDVQDRASSGNSDNYHLGAYGGGQWGALGLRGGVAYSWHDITTRRSVSIPSFTDRLKANYDGRTAQVFADLSYRIDTSSVSFEPFANVAYVNLKTDGYTESGGAAALRAKGQTTDTTFTTLGTRASSSFELAGAQAAARGSLGWRHAFGDVNPVAAQTLSAGNSFTVAGVPIAKDSAVIEAGVDVQITSRATFGLSYQGQLASSTQDHGVRAGLNIRF
ncbi:hypothetical protein CE205_15810 [Achromobacter insolitus]|uniref:autotransporter-associated beta strand repeat-containing protein n=1 Tax=Achromobacter insolitus TaxID=217204 RepID=UPI000DD10952|nr:autotransporter-associated beta strand repeat-containing protein [Achromobacter insolitus]AXA71961.1 hypothetical protein CE205_15810 [Achromobacter insolitus]